MTAEQFCYWLQGYMEVTQAVTGQLEIDHIAAKVINDHLQTVFHKVTPTYQFPTLPRTTTLPYPVPQIGSEQLTLTC